MGEGGQKGGEIIFTEDWLLVWMRRAHIVILVYIDNTHGRAQEIAHKDSQGTW